VAHKRFDDRVEQAALSAIHRIEQAALSRLESHSSESSPGNDQRQHCGEELVQLSTMLREAAQRVAHLADTGVEGEKQPVRADALIEAKPKATPADAPVQPPLRLHA